MALLIRAGCVLAVLCLVTAQTNEDLDSLISQIYPETEENTTTNNPPSTGEDGVIDLTSPATLIGESVDGPRNCTCVPYYLCKPIDRAKEDLCENYFEFCCFSWNNDVSKLIDIK